MVKRNNYREAQDRARARGVELQEQMMVEGISWGELATLQNKAYAIAKNHGLVKEFQENGLL